MAGTSRQSPAELTPGWPDIESPDIAAEAVRQFALACMEVAGGLSARQVAKQSGVNHSVFTRILRGETWPDARSIRLLEAGLEASLWPAWRPVGADDALADVLDPVDGGDGPEHARDGGGTPV